VNLSERLMKAAMERRAQPGVSAQRVRTSTDSQSTNAPDEMHAISALPPDRAQGPVDAGRVAVMKMRLPEPTNPDATTTTSTGLPLWQRPLADVMREAGLATVTSLPIAPRDHDASDEDLDGVELAQTIPMPGVWAATSVVDVDRSEFHVPPLATSESLGLAGGSLDSDHHDHIDLSDHHHGAHGEVTINLDHVTIDAEIVDVSSADALLDRWSHDVTADMHDRQEKVDGLYRQMLDAAQRPRITFGPIDLRDEITLPAEPALPRVDDEHTCPDCGARASVDIHDPMRGRIHLSCDSCFKMWQLRVASTVISDEPFMRD